VASHGVGDAVNAADWVGAGLNFAWASAKSLPGGRATTEWLSDAERQVVRAVRQHLEDVDPPALDAPEAVDEDDDAPTPERVFRALMERSMYDRPVQSAAALHLALVSALLPDEARILAAVSDGARYPVIHVAEPGVGAPVYLSENASTVGRAAGVALPDKTPVYLVRMLRLGLITIGPEDTSMRDDYEMLLTDSAVHAAIGAVSGMRGARVIRRTVGISELGQEVWEAAK
jgi:hypothetical protein